MMKRGKVDKQGESMFASYRYLEVSNPGLQMIGSNEWIPALYYFQAYKAGILSTHFSGWLKPTQTTPNFRKRKIPRFDFDRNNQIMSWGQKKIFLNKVI